MLPLLAPTDSVRLEYRPRGLADSPAPVVSRPLTLAADGTGDLKALGQTLRVRSEESGGVPRRLTVGGTTVDWRSETKMGWTRYVADLDLPVGSRRAHLTIVRIASPTALTVLPDYGYVGRAHLDGKTYAARVTGEIVADAKVWIDRNGDGKRQASAEVVAAGAPFNLNGPSHVLVLAPDGFRVTKSPRVVARIPDAPDLRLGKPMPRLALATTDGATIRLPETTRGRLVLLDFWASWCPPCVEALPVLAKANARLGGPHLQIVSVNLDTPDAKARADELARSRGLVWTQVADGQGFAGPVAARLGLEAIPLMLLIDGDTGRIVATDAEFGRDGIEPTLEAALRRKFGRIAAQ